MDDFITSLISKYLDFLEMNKKKCAVIKKMKQNKTKKTSKSKRLKIV